MNAQTKIEVPIPGVYGAIAAVMADIAKEGISKDRRNQQQGYSFRGIDEVYNALSPILARHKLCILPRMIARNMSERQTQKGGALFNVTVEAEFDFVSAVDGSHHTVRTFGEAMDSADKATNKAMSAAYKYAAMQAFCIPTEGDNDADAVSHEVAPREVKPEPVAKAEMPDTEWAKLVNMMKATDTPPGPMLKHFGVENLRHLNQDQYGQAMERLNSKLAEMAKAETNAAAEISDADIPY
jgi:hypothetical protein